MRAIPAKEELTICFAHIAYRMAERFARRETGIRHFQVSTLDELTARLGEPARTNMRAMRLRPPASGWRVRRA
jgi:hypothetical protein